LIAAALHNRANSLFPNFLKTALVEDLVMKLLYNISFKIFTVIQAPIPDRGVWHFNVNGPQALTFAHLGGA
jgi:hypothetical protein